MDWSGITGEMAERIRQHDWNATPIGPVDTWPQPLRTAVSLMLGAVQPVYIAWGPQLTSLYNDGYLPIVGTKHPGLGVPFAELWAEIWDDFRPLVEKTLAGESQYFIDMPIALAGRPGVPISYFTFSYTALRNEEGQIAGFYCAATETTDNVKAEAALREIEAQHRDVLDSMAEGFALFDADFTILDVNAETLRLDGRPREELVGQSHWDAFPGSEHSPLGKMYKQVMRDRVPAELEHACHLPDGKTMWLETRAYPTARGRIACLSGDVTDRKLANGTVKESAEQFRRSVLEGPIPVIIQAEDGEVLQVSRSWTEQTGYTLEDNAVIQGWLINAFGLCGEDIRGAMELVLQRIDSAGSMRAVDFKMVTRSGELRHWSFSASSPGTLRDGRRFVVGMAEDVTERVRAAALLSEREAELALTQEIGRVASVDVLLTDPPTGSRSPEYRRLHGLSTDVISETHQQWLDRLHPDDRQTQDRIFRDAIVSGSNYSAEYRIVRPDNGDIRWISARAKIERDAGGKAVRLRGSHIDITERKRADAALHASERRFRQFAEASSDVLWIVDAASGQLDYLSPSFERVWGVPREKVTTDLSRWADMLHPDDRERATAILPRALAGEAIMQDYRIVRGDGAIRYITDVGFPILDDAGRVIRVGGIAQDLTDRRKAEEAVKTSEGRLSMLVEGIPQLVWRAGAPGLWTWASPQWTAYTGQSEADSHGWGWIEAVHPDDRPAARTALANAVANGGFKVDYRLCRARDRTYRWFHTRATPVRDSDGIIVEWLGTSTDIDESRDLQDRQKLLLAELQHRVRNILTVISSVFERTIETSDDLDEVALHFRGRLGALARTQVIITANATGTVDLENLIRDELISVGIADGPTLALSGPDVVIDARMAETLALAIHELTVNALKYGALKVAGAKLNIGWSIGRDKAGQKWLDILWREEGVPAVALSPIRSGFGRELIEQALPYRSGARTSLEFRGGGVWCSISIPMDHVAGGASSGGE